MKERRTATKDRHAGVFGLAVELHRNGHRSGTRSTLEHAEALYRQILADAPEHVGALHFLGILLHQTDRSDDGIAVLEKALALSPDDPDISTNLGNVLKETGRLAEASEIYQRAISLRPGHADAHSNLGTVLRTAGRLDEAISEYRRAIELDPKHVPAHKNLAGAYRRLGRRDEAIAEYKTVLELDPTQAEARRLLGLELRAAGRNEESIAVFRGWAEHDKGDPIAAHLFAACSGEGVPARASDAYVVRTFDQAAANFEEHIGLLGYQGPKMVGAAIAREIASPDASLEVLDAGCGTGLCGPVLRPYAKRLVGVDLSHGMLDRARAKGVYDELVQMELTELLRRSAARYDLIAAGDAFIYFGDLDPVFEAAAGALRPRGRLVFTLEKAAPEASSFVLETHGRYAHPEAYLRVHLEAAGLSAHRVDEDVVRFESGAPVRGWVVTALAR